MKMVEFHKPQFLDDAINKFEGVKSGDPEIHSIDPFLPIQQVF